jgi:hypothetical protein
MVSKFGPTQSTHKIHTLHHRIVAFIFVTKLTTAHPSVLYQVETSRILENIVNKKLRELANDITRRQIMWIYLKDKKDFNR